MKKSLVLPAVLLVSVALVTAACGRKDDGDDVKAAPERATRLTEAMLEEMLQVEVPGFEQQPGARIETVMGLPYTEVQYRGTEGNEHDMTGFVTVRVFGCGHCPELSAAGFEAEGESLYERMMLPSVHKENPEAVFEIGETTLADRKFVSVYHLSFVASDDGGRASAHGYNVYHHDGVTMLRIGVSSRAVKGFKMADDLDQLKSLFSREEKKAAAAVFAEALSPVLF